jgi:hypothetical protein
MKRLLHFLNPNFKLLVLLCLGGFSQKLGAQNGNNRFFLSDSIQFLKDGKPLEMPFTGGFNMPAFSQIDLNNDGKPDLVVLDRGGNSIMTFINTGTKDFFKFQYAPQYEFIFRNMQLDVYVQFRDFNQDGKPDLFTLEGSRFRVHMNITQAQDSFVKFRRMGEIFARNNNTTGILFNPLGGRLMDLPILDDLDNDGDIDYVIYESSTGNLELYLNEQVELGLSNDTFAFRLVDMCWGGFREADNNEIFLNCNRTHFPNYYRRSEMERRHLSGTTLLAIDMNNDGAKELIVGNGGFKNLLYLMNGKTQLNLGLDSMVSYTKAFPSVGLNEIKLSYTPALYNFDLDGDGVKDLLAAPYFYDVLTERTSASSNNVIFAKNVGTNELPNFEIRNRNFLMDESLNLGFNTGPVFWDVNKDGLIDLLVTVEPDSITFTEKQSARIYYYKNVGNAALPAYELMDEDFANVSFLNLKGISLAIGDLNSDGKTDLLLGDHKGALTYLINISETANSANPKFQIGSFNLLPGQFEKEVAPAIFDYNRDGKPDLIIGKVDGELSYYRNTTTSGSSSLTFALVTHNLGKVKVNGGYATPLFYDFEGDNKPELICGNRLGTIQMWNISWDHTYPFPEIKDFYGVLNANEDTTYGIKMGIRTKVAVADVREGSGSDILVGCNRGGLYYFSKAERRVLSVNNTPDLVHTLSVTPNPNKGQFDLLLPASLIDLDLQLELFDFSGRRIESMHLSNPSINLQNRLSAGVYFGTLKHQGLIKASFKFTIEE